MSLAFDWTTAPSLVSAQATLNYTERGETLALPTVEFTVPEAGDGHAIFWGVVVPPRFSGWSPEAISVLMAIKSWTKVSTNLDVTLKIKQGDGTVVKTVTVTYSSSEAATELTKFSVGASDLRGKFRPGDLLWIEVGSPDSGNTGTSSADWTHVLSRMCVNWK